MVRHVRWMSGAPVPLGILRLSKTQSGAAERHFEVKRNQSRNRVHLRVGAEAASLAPEKAAWRAWYVQAAYMWPETKWELVARHGQFRAPDEEMELDQTAFGVNYWLSANAVAKAALELNDSAAGSPEDGNRWLVQIAYGF